MGRNKSKDQKKDQDGGSGGLHFTYIIQIGLSILAAYLNWDCLVTQTTPIRVITTIMAFFFATYYLIFYLVFKVIMGRTC